MMSDEQLIYNVHRDIWPDELLGEQYSKLIEKIMSKTERQIIEHKVEGYDDAHISKVFKMTRDSLEARLREIRSKLRNGVDCRVDDWVRKTRSMYPSKY